jgi:transposase
MKDDRLDNNIITLFSRGWAIRRLAREFNVSRNRVRRILIRHHMLRDQGEEPLPPKSTRRSKLDAYKEYIGEQLEEFAATPPTCQRLFELIQEKGYDGGITILKDYLATVRPKAKPDPILTVETEPGQQGQHDWSDYTLTFTRIGKPEIVTFFSFILSYSRRQYLEVTEDKTQTTLFRALINSFTHLKGVPGEIRSDNQKACVDRWEAGKPVFNARYLQFATHYQFRPLAIRPGKPSENLKVERPFYYLETNFLNARHFLDRQDLKDQLAHWLRTRNDVRIHRTTQRSPLDLHQEEISALIPLPRKPFDTSTLVYRIVNNEACCELLVIHPLAEKDRKDRYIGRPLARRKRSVLLDADDVIDRLKAFGPPMETFIQEIKKHRPENYLYHLRGILALKYYYHAEDIVAAVQRATQYRVFEYRAIENFLETNSKKRNEPEIMPPKDKS